MEIKLINGIELDSDFEDFPVYRWRVSFYSSRSAFSAGAPSDILFFMEDQIPAGLFRLKAEDTDKPMGEFFPRNNVQKEYYLINLKKDSVREAIAEFSKKLVEDELNFRSEYLMVNAGKLSRYDIADEFRRLDSYFCIYNGVLNKENKIMCIWF